MANDIVSEESLLGPAIEELNGRDEQQQIEKIRNEAKNFLTEIKKAIQKRRRTEKSVRAVLKRSPNNSLKISQIYAAMHEDTDLTQMITKAQFNFEAKFNEFLGRKIHFIWIDTTTGSFYFTDEIRAREIYAKGTRKRGGRASVNAIYPEQDGLKNFNELPALLGEYGNRIIEHQEMYSNLYHQVLRRWDRNTHEENNHWYQMQEPKNVYPYRETFYWWRSPTDYGHSVKMSQGNISEAYIHILMNSEQVDSGRMTLLSTGSIQDQVESYWYYMTEHSLMNNKAGITEGDVLLVGRETTQFAVKANTFNTAAVGPYITLAYNILTIKEGYASKEEILKSLPKIKQATSAIRNTIEVLSDKALKEAIK